MSEVMRNAIETSSHVTEELMITQEQFDVNEVWPTVILTSLARNNSFINV